MGTQSRLRLPITIMRGGTSRAVFIVQSDLPEDRAAWDPLLLRLMGSPDKKQIDGLGGSQAVTSKVAIIRKSDRPDADVDYTFAQVSVDKPVVSYEGNCGNTLAGVGPFAIERGLVRARGAITAVRIFNTNTEKTIVADVQTPEGEVIYGGDFAIAGVPGTGAPVKLRFVNPAGTLGRGLLPTGSATDTLDVPGHGAVEVSIVDAVTPMVFVGAGELGLSGAELPEEFSAKHIDLLEKIRGLAAERLGMIEDAAKSAWESPLVPRIAVVERAADYATVDEKIIPKRKIDLLARMMFMQRPHPAFAMTGAMCLAAAAVAPGSAVNRALAPDADTQFIRIGHPGGVLECGVDFRANGAEPVVDNTFGFRTANLLFEGTAAIDPTARN